MEESQDRPWTNVEGVCVWVRAEKFESSRLVCGAVKNELGLILLHARTDQAFARDADALWVSSPPPRQGGEAGWVAAAQLAPPLSSVPFFI